MVSAQHPVPDESLGTPMNDSQADAEEVVGVFSPILSAVIEASL
jgi:hypothetical protein